MLGTLIDVGYGFIICWLLNLVQLAIAFLLLASSDRMLVFVYVMTAALGLTQMAYVVPIYRLLRRKGKRYAARGLLSAAFVTAIANLLVDYYLFGPPILQFWR